MNACYVVVCLDLFDEQFLILTAAEFTHAYDDTCDESCHCSADRNHVLYDL